jgi:hypothetical protein
MSDGDKMKGWDWKNGWRAAAWMLLCVELIFAGTSRTCMSSFEPGMLPYLLLLFNIFGVPELWLVTGGLAFVIAARPTPIVKNTKGRTITVAIAFGVGVSFQLVWPHDPTTQPWLSTLCLPLASTAYAVAVGLLLNGSERVRRYWLPLAVAMALAIGVFEFLVLPYGTPNCYF